MSRRDSNDKKKNQPERMGDLHTYIHHALWMTGSKFFNLGDDTSYPRMASK